MKLILAIVQDADAPGLTKALLEKGFRSTKLASTGGFLREGNTTLLLGVEDEQLEEALEIIREKCRTRTRLITPGVPLAEAPDPFLAQPVEVQVGGAVVFVLPVESFFKI
ncbi:MAG: cyclic-di-AMP receptor [Thermaceae bacterium]